MSVGAGIDAALQGALDHGLPGVAVAARLASGEVVQAAAGVRQVGEPAAMTPDTVCWIASFTKALTTVAVLRLVEAGQLGLDDPVSRWLPDLAQPTVLSGFGDDGAPILGAAKRPIVVSQLLDHTSGLAYDFCNAQLARYTAAARGAARHETPLVFQPGEGWTYGVGLDWAGELVAAVSGRSLDVYLAEEVFAPLGMADTVFTLGEAQRGRLAGMHRRGEDGAPTPMPFQLPPAPNPAIGGGGLYGTASDYLKFLDAVIAGGGPILSPASVAAMATPRAEGLAVGVLGGVNRQLCVGFDPFPGQTKQFGLGFVINPAPAPGGRSAGSLAWAGLANCYYWADPARGVAGVFLTQLLPFGDPAALEAFGEFERAVYSA